MICCLRRTWPALSWMLTSQPGFIDYRAFFENLELELEVHLALEWGSKFINLEMAWTAQGDAESRLPAGFKSHRMPLHVVEPKMKLSDLKMVAPSSRILSQLLFPNAFAR